MININIGILGHVDCGKTTLCKTLSTIASTACFDKNPQSKERGITLDLGFSSFKIEGSEIPNDLKNSLDLTNESVLQFTLVDCPGHSSLIRTILCGAQIIDIMILVIDVTKGIQTQTAECLVIGEILCSHMIVVLNKIDLIPEKEREVNIAKMKRRLLLTFSKTKFKKCSIVEVAANPGGNIGENDIKMNAIGMDSLVSVILENLENPTKRRLEGSKQPLVFAVDHCFTIRGQGTILTGTVLSGTVDVGDTLSIPAINMEKKIKSMQMFKKPVTKAIQGDRVGICVTQMDANLFERGLICKASPNQPLSIIESCIIRFTPINYFKSSIKSKSKFHLTIGHDTMLGVITLFTCNKGEPDSFCWSTEYEYLESYPCESLPVDRDIFVLIKLERPVVCSVNSMLIGSKLDTDIHSPTCRLAFYGNVLWMNSNSKNKETDLNNLKVFKPKTRMGVLERLNDNRTAIVKNLFKKETNIEIFQNMLVTFEASSNNSEGDCTKYFQKEILGRIGGNFGQSGKCKVILQEDFPEELCEMYRFNNKKKTVSNEEEKKVVINVVLRFKQFIFDSKKKMCQ